MSVYLSTLQTVLLECNRIVIYLPTACSATHRQANNRQCWGIFAWFVEYFYGIFESLSNEGT